MSVRQYIGARYVPRFSEVNGGVWSNVYSYEPLTIVKNGNDYYTSKQSVPVGVAITNTDYWVKTGDYNGAISALDTRLTAAETSISKIPTNRKFVLIGDSFGVGIIGGGAPWATGWIYYMNQILPGKCHYYDPAGDQSFEGVSAFTSVSDKNFIGQLNYVYENKLGTTLPEEITDVVVLGGTNEISGASVSQIAGAIDTFCSRSRAIFPNANISIGLIGTEGRKFMYVNNVYSGYKLGAARNGARFMSDCLNLGTSYTYNSGFGHWSSAGYDFMVPNIANMIMGGSVDACISEDISLDYYKSSAPTGATYNAVLRVTLYKDKTIFQLFASNTSSGLNAITPSLIGGGIATRTNKIFRTHKTNINYCLKIGDPVFNADYVFTKQSYSDVPIYGGKSDIMIGWDSDINEFTLDYLAQPPIASDTTGYTYSQIIIDKLGMIQPTTV